MVCAQSQLADYFQLLLLLPWGALLVVLSSCLASPQARSNQALSLVHGGAAVCPHDGFSADVRVVGVVRVVALGAAIAEMEVEDWTGRISVHMYLTDVACYPARVDNGTCIVDSIWAISCVVVMDGVSRGVLVQMTIWRLFGYVAVVGRFRVFPSVRIQARVIQSVSAPNDVAYHAIEAVRLMLRLAPPGYIHPVGDVERRGLQVPRSLSRSRSPRRVGEESGRSFTNECAGFSPLPGPTTLWGSSSTCSSTEAL